MLNPTPRVSQSNEQAVSELTVRALFESEETALLRYAFSLVGRRVVAEEIVQDVFLKLHANWDDVEAPRAWLFTSVRNAAFNYFRKHKREVLGSHDVDESATNVGMETPDDLMQRVDVIRLLREMLGELDETDQQLVKLKYFEGLKYREISERTGMSVSNVGYRLHHILKDLSRRLRPLGIDETL